MLHNFLKPCSGKDSREVVYMEIGDHMLDVAKNLVAPRMNAITCAGDAVANDNASLTMLGDCETKCS